MRSGFPYMSRSRRGFSLSEMAIVLSIIGIIGSGIWLTYGIASNSNRTAQMGNDINYILGRLNNGSFSLADFPATAKCFSYKAADGSTQYWGSSTNNGMAYLAAMAKIIPRDMYYAYPLTATMATPVINPWGNKFDLDFYTGGQGCTSASGNAPGQVGNDVILDTGNMPAASCIQMLNINKANWVNHGMVQFCMNNCAAQSPWFGNDSTVLTPAIIQADCTVSDPVDVQLYFNWPM